MIFKYVAGNKMLDALRLGNKYLANNTIPIINYISENINSKNMYYSFKEYNKLIDNIDSNFMLALKLSSLNFDTNLIYSICDRCKNKKIKLIIDAEDEKNIYNYRNIVNSIILKYNKKDFNNSKNGTIIKTFQMYRKDSLDELNDDIKFMKNNLCSIKEYSSIIKILVSIVLIQQILDYLSYGNKHTKWIVMIIYIVILVMYLGIDYSIKPVEKILKDNCENK